MRSLVLAVLIPMLWPVALVGVAACSSPPPPVTRHRVVEVLRLVAPTLTCTPEPRVGGLDVALCQEEKTVLLCTGGGLSAVECGPAVKLADKPAGAP